MSYYCHDQSTQQGLGLSWSEEEICFEAVLAGVEVVVAATARVEGFVRTTFDDIPLFNNEDLVCPPDGREAVGDHERSAALHEIAEAILDHSFRLGVEGAGGLVKDEDARIGEDGTGDGETLALASGKLDAALPDDGVVLLRKPLGELVDSRNTTGLHELLDGGVRTAEEDVLAYGAVEEKCLLQNDAKLFSITRQADSGQVDAVDQNTTANWRCGRRRSAR